MRNVRNLSRRAEPIRTDGHDDALLVALERLVCRDDVREVPLLRDGHGLRAEGEVGPVLRPLDLPVAHRGRQLAVLQSDKNVSIFDQFVDTDTREARWPWRKW